MVVGSSCCQRRRTEEEEEEGKEEEGGRKGKGVDGAEEIGYGLKLGRSSKVRGFGGGCAKNTIPMTDGGKYVGGEGVGGGILEEEAECPSCCWRH